MPLGISRSFCFKAVVPAAGLSSRMGAFKPLLPAGGRTVIEAAVGSAEPYVERVAVTVGYRGDEVAAALCGRFGDKTAFARNPDYALTDMLRSVQLGLKELGECDAFFLLPADMPLIPASVYEALIAAFDDSADVIYPVFNGRRGHPPLIHARLIPDILDYEGDGGLRAILSGRKIKEVEIPHEGILTDLDTPEDYERAGLAAGNR